MSGLFKPDQKNEMFSEENEFSSRGYIEANLESLIRKKILEDDEQVIILVIGKAGVGKSTLTRWIEKYVYGEINTDWDCFEHDEWQKLSTTRPLNKLIKYEEGRDTFYRRNAVTKKNKEGNDILSQYRAFKHIHLINFQNLSDLEPDLLYYHADALIRITHKGWLWGYSASSIQQIDISNKNNRVDWGSYDFRDSFKDFSKRYPDEWEEYEQEKIKRLEEKAQPDEEDEESQEEEDSLEKHYKVKKAANILDVHPDTIRRWCQDDRIEYTKISHNIRVPKSEIERILAGDEAVSEEEKEKRLENVKA